MAQEKVKIEDVVIREWENYKKVREKSKEEEGKRRRSRHVR